jgi:hypothetical protein
MADPSSTVDSVLPQIPTGQAIPNTKQRLFGRTKNVHAILGGRQIADILLWKKWQISAAILGVATVTWVLFEWSGYTLLTLLANTALILVVAVFVWAQVAHFLNRPPPPLPELALSEDMVQWTAENLRKEVNNALAIAHSVALGKDYKLFAKVVVGLYVLATVGAWFNTLSLFFFGVLAAFTLPLLYDKYEDHVDSHAMKGLDELHKLWAIVENKVKDMMHKIPHEGREKKLQ